MGKDKIPDSDRKTIMDKCNELVGWITIKLQKLMNTKTNKKKQKVFVIQSLPNFINKQEDRKVECQEECLGECLVEPQEACLEGGMPGGAPGGRPGGSGGPTVE